MFLKGKAMTNLRNLLVSLLYTSIILATTSVYSATYYVDTNSPNDNGAGSSSDPVKYIGTGISMMSSSGGDTLIIKNGTYSSSQDSMSSFVSGTTGNYNIIKAENDSGVIVTRGLSINNMAHHLQFEGLKFVSNNQNSISNAHHIKILRSAFEGGPLSGNNYTFGMGTNNPGESTEYILIEDSWFYGPGGRQNLLIYKSNKVVIRRVVLRHDLGWSNVGKTDPEGVGTIYNSNNVELQNVIVIDSSHNPANTGSEWVGGFTVVNNVSSGGTCKDNNITGTIVLNVEGNGFEVGGDGQVLNIQFNDSIVWWSPPSSVGAGGASAISMNNPGYKTVTATNMTIGNIASGVALWGGNNSNITLKNSILYGMNSFPIGTPSSGDGTITHSYNNCSNNANNNTCTSATGTVTFDPTANGLSHITRIENGTTLMTAGQSGGRIGAIITNKVGVSGTLWGDAGYNTITNNPLWPWPNESRIHDDMSSISNRGFSAPGQTLTNYIWSALGNAPPSNIASIQLPAPKNIKYTKNK